MSPKVAHRPDTAAPDDSFTQSPPEYLEPERPSWYDDQSWVDQAACAGRSDLFFPSYAERPQSRERREQHARSLCAQCPVHTPCMWWGRLHHEYGIWGGENEEGRVRAGYTLMAPIGTRHLSRDRRQRPTPMPLAEMMEPTAEELAEIERWARTNHIA